MSSRHLGAAYWNMPGVDAGGRVYGTQPGTVIVPSQHMIRTYTHRGQLGSWFTYAYCLNVHGFPQDADARTVGPGHRRWLRMGDGRVLTAGQRVSDLSPRV